MHNLGLSFAEQGRYEEAIAAYRKALSMPIYPTPEVGYYNLGRAYAQINKYPGRRRKPCGPRSSFSPT